MFYDVAIIGSGPCGLAAAARLKERTPAALFTNDEHARYWKNHRRQNNSLEAEQKRRRKSSTDSGYGSETDEADVSSPAMVVLDAASDKWMGMWRQRFRNLNIEHLRSPLFFHPDPRDRDGLLAFAHEHGRLNELCEIPNVVGKELSKHEKKRQHSRKQARTTARHLRIDGRDQIDYYTPSSRLFDDYCDMLIKRYRLDGIVQQTRVADINYDPIPANLEHGLFTITTSSQETIFAKVVVIATGPSVSPSVPGIHLLPSCSQRGSITHVFQPRGAELPPHVLRKISQRPTEPVTILIVGGGLTSAQIAHLFLSKHRSVRVQLLLRHPKLKCKPFDIDLTWVSKTRNHLMSAFWSADTDEERLKMMRQARNGGSVNGPFAKILRQHMAEDRINIHVNTQLDLDGCLWDETTSKWTFLNIQPCPKVSTGACFPFPGGVDHVVFATGATPNFENIDFLKSLRIDWNIQSIGGLPVLNDDLMLHDDVPCFCTGGLAGLRLGPGAANLAGARQGAERMAWRIEDLLGLNARSNGSSSQLEHHKVVHTEEDRSEFTGSFGNQFAALDIE